MRKGSLNSQGNTVNFDYSSGMPVDSEVLDEMIPYMTEKFGNRSAIHFSGQQAQSAIASAQIRLGKLIGAANPEDEICFTSSATESNNLALRGIAFKNKERGNHLMISAIEHISVRNVAKFLQLQGFEITIVPVDTDGIVDVDFLKDHIQPGTTLISTMHANSEIGTIQPIEEISRISHEEEIILHVDGTASLGKIPIDVAKTNIDLLTLSSNDIGGPKGMGGLFVREGTTIEPIIFGGGQQRGLRSGSEDVPGIVGMGKAAEISFERIGSDRKRIEGIRDRIINSVLEEISETSLYGHRTNRLPTNAMVGIFGVEGEQAILELDKHKILASTGSACSSKNLALSHVLAALGVKEIDRYGTILFSLSRLNQNEDVDRLMAVLPRIVNELREISPIWSFRDRLEEFHHR